MEEFTIAIALKAYELIEAFLLKPLIYENLRQT